MAIDEQHVALPKLYGAPAYARPPRPAAVVDRPFDPDDLPIEIEMTPEERDLARDAAGPVVRARWRDAASSARVPATPSGQEPTLQPEAAQPARARRPHPRRRQQLTPAGHRAGTRSPALSGLPHRATCAPDAV